MKFNIFAPRNYRSGLGHYMRMQTLAEALRSRYEVPVILDELTDRPNIKGLEDSVVIVDSDVGSDVFIDKIQRTYKDGVYTVAIFDATNGATLAACEEKADLVINTNPIHGDANYVIIDPIFYKYRKNTARRSVKHVFVFMGGSDPWSSTVRVVNGLNFLCGTYKLHVVLGSEVSKFLIEQVEKLYLFHLYQDLDREEMAALMGSCDMAVTAPGQSFYELCAVNIPSIIVSHHTRHEELGAWLHKQGVALDCGIAHQMKDEDFINVLSTALDIIDDKSTRVKLVTKANKLFDGNGVYRICNAIKEMVEETNQWAEI